MEKAPEAVWPPQGPAVRMTSSSGKMSGASPAITGLSQGGPAKDQFGSSMVARPSGTEQGSPQGEAGPKADNAPGGASDGPPGYHENAPGVETSVLASPVGNHVSAPVWSAGGPSAAGHPAAAAQRQSRTRLERHVRAMAPACPTPTASGPLARHITVFPSTSAQFDVRRALGEVFARPQDAPGGRSRYPPFNLHQTRQIEICQVEGAPDSAGDSLILCNRRRERTFPASVRFRHGLPAGLHGPPPTGIMAPAAGVCAAPILETPRDEGRGDPGPTRQR